MLYPAPLPQYECQVTPKPLESTSISDKPKDAAEPSKASVVRSEKLFNPTTRWTEICQNCVSFFSFFQTVSLKNKKKKSRAKGKKMSRECDGEEDGKEAESSPQKATQRSAEPSSESSAPSFHPSWKRTSSDTEVSDSEGNAQSKLRHAVFRLKRLPPLLAWLQNGKGPRNSVCVCVDLLTPPPAGLTMAVCARRR